MIHLYRRFGVNTIYNFGVIMETELKNKKVENKTNVSARYL